MPEFVHVFQAGRMNKDLDERLVPNGEYRDALNLDLANSENGNVGSLQNIKGTLERRGHLGNPDWSGSYIDALTNPVCIGSIRNDATEKIYWFIASSTVSTIAEFSQTTKEIAPVIVDTKNILKFTDNYLITGINIIEKFLFWTDDQTEPKKINIDKFKTGSTNFLTHTKIPKYNSIQQSYEVNLTGQPDFTEADTTVIKISPLAAPIVTASASKHGSNVPGTGLLPVSTTMTTSGFTNFTYVEDTSTDAIARVPLDTYGQYLVNINTSPSFYSGSSIPNWNGEITFVVNTIPTAWAAGDIVKLDTDFTTEFFANYKYELSIKLTAVNNTSITGRIQAISNIETFRDANDTIIIYNWKALLVEEAPMFEYVFPRFAYRWKFIDNEYSTFSPFSEVAFVGGKFEYLASNGFNVGMTNNIRLLEIGNLAWDGQEVVELDILFKESNTQAIYRVETLTRADFPVLPSTFQVETELIGAIVEANQILRPWDNVPRAAKSQEIIGNRIVYGNYLQNYDVGTTTLNLTNTPTNHPAVQDENKIRLPFSSVKSIRTYQAGVVYIDAYGRETPVFTSKQASTKIDVVDSNKTNKLTITPTNIAPSFASHYKFFVKEISTEYYNLALDRFYEAEDGNVWLSFPSSERNKVDEETYLILKKQHDTNKQVLGLNRYKILSIESEAPEFISTFDTVIVSSIVENLATVEVGFLSINFKGPTSAVSLNFGTSLNGNKVRFQSGASVSEVYDVSNSRTSNATPVADPVEIDYLVTLDRPLGPDAAFLADVNVGSDFSITILEDEVKNKPEFAGRFFAKVQRNFAFDTNIISSFAAMPVQYSILSEFQPDIGYNLANNPGPDYYTYADIGARNTVFGCSNKASSLKVVGWDPANGIGNAITDVGNSGNDLPLKLAALQPPTRGSKKFGVLYLGEKAKGGGDFVDNMFGNSNVSQFIGGNWAAAVATPDGFLSPGAAIRFQNKVDGEFSQVYTVDEALGQRSYRGRRISPAGGCDFSDTGYNWKYVIYIELDKPITEDWIPLANQWSTLETVLPQIQALEPVIAAGKKLTSQNPAIFETEPKETVDLDLYYEASDSLPIANYNTANQPINWMNCYSYGTGVESNRIRDDFNAVFIDKGPKVSTVLDEPYAAERRGSGFIFSQIFNSTSGINRLNQFIQALPITKDLNPIYGTIQKLHARDTDLITLCEDKCFRVLANKDALFNADGNVNVTSNNAVLGQTIPYAGDFGISKNPESFADYGFRVYFSDRNRGSVIRLSRDGITEISTKGMDDFFSDNLRASKNIIGSYDEDKGLYNLKLDNVTPEWRKILSTDTNYQLSTFCETPAVFTDANKSFPTTVSFKESVNGWTSRKSFLPESGISLNNTYYTFNKGLIWEHNINNVYNNFYGVQYISSFNVIINEIPNVVKGYSTLNYSGTKSRELEYEFNSKWYSIAEIHANVITPTATQVKTEGWRVDYVRTNLESGEIKEFENKEGKYFNYIKALNVCKTGNGIGTSTPSFDAQDYNLTVTISTTCSSSGGSIPDTLISAVYGWSIVNPLTSMDIRPDTPQEAKCNIETFYNPLQQNYIKVSNSDLQFKYISTVGLIVGAVLYDNNTLLPATTTSGMTILYTGVDTLSNAALDANNSQAVPNTYKLITVNAAGSITSIIQYNTLAACAGDPTSSLRGTSGVNDPNVPNLFFSIPVVTSAELVCSIKGFMLQWLALDPETRSGGQWSVPTVYWYGDANFVVGTQLYSESNGAFVKKNVNSAGNPGYNRKEVYNLTTGGVMPFGNKWTVEANKPDNNTVIVSTNGTGVITAIEIYNTFSYTCP